MNNPKFELFKSPNNEQYYFRLRSSNGEITLSSEAYMNKQSCENGIESVKTNAAYDEQYIRLQRNSSYTFNLKAANGEIIGRSESYTSGHNRDMGIESVKKEAPTAPVEELS